MSTVRVKICGIQTEEEALAGAAEGADALGFVFAESPRRVTPEEAAAAMERLPPFVSRTGVFVDETLEEVRRIARLCGLDVLQLHGGESPGYCRALRPWRIIKSFPANSALIPEECARYRPAAVLLDTAYPERRGGGGRTFDWRLAEPFAGHASFPLILAGGLDPGNVFRALEAVRPYGVDVSSGVEKNGAKCRQKIREFIGEVRRWEERQKMTGEP